MKYRHILKNAGEYRMTSWLTVFQLTLNICLPAGFHLIKTCILWIDLLFFRMMKSR